MDICTLLLIIIFQFLNTTMAEWNPKSPLIIVGLPLHPNIFPYEVRWSDRYQCKVYYDSESESPEKRDTLITYAYCPRNDDDDDDEDDDDDGLCNYAEPFVMSKYEHGEHPTEECSMGVEFDMVKVTNFFGHHESCNHDGQTGHLYKFMYWLCEYDKNEKTGINVYEACYQETEKQIILGSYTIQIPGLLGNPLLQDERDAQFELDTWTYKDDNLDHFHQITLPLYNRSMKYVSRPVLPSEWLPFALQRKPLYHMTNIAPMDVNLNKGWEELMVNLRDRLSRMNEPVNVTAGLLDVLKDKEGNNKYLGWTNDKWQIAIARVWWVLIYNRNNSRGVVIMMHNERYYANKGNPNISYYDDRRCSLDVCNSANIRNALPNDEQFPHNFIYCCEPSVITDKFDLAGSNRILVLPEA